MADTSAYGTSELEDSRDYRLLAESIPNLAWIAQSDGAIFWYNRRWYEYTGTSPAQMAGWGWQRVHDPAMLPSVMVRWQTCIATGQPFEMTFPLKGADEVFRPFLTRVLPLRDADGTVQRWFGTNTDVGDDLRAAAALRESEERFRTATAAVSGVLWTNTANGEMLGEQPGWSEFTGQTREQYQGYGWAAAVHPEDAQPSIDAWQEAVREQRLFAFEHRVMRHDGIYRLCSVRALPICREDGTVREWVGVHTDITAQKQAEEALRRNDKLAIAGRLASSIAHEINNPLDTISNLLHLLRETKLNDEARNLCEMMAEEVRRVIEITNNTLGFQRQATHPAGFKIDLLLDSVQGLFAGRLRSLNVRCQTRFRAKGEVCGFEGEIRQVLANLVGNAGDAMGAVASGRTLYLRTADAIGRTGNARGCEACESSLPIPGQECRRQRWPRCSLRSSPPRERRVRAWGSGSAARSWTGTKAPSACVAGRRARPAGERMEPCSASSFPCARASRAEAP